MLGGMDLSWRANYNTLAARGAVCQTPFSAAIDLVSGHLRGHRKSAQRSTPNFPGFLMSSTDATAIHVSGGRTKHSMILVWGAQHTTARPVGLSSPRNTRSHGTAIHVSSINTS